MIDAKSLMCGVCVYRGDCSLMAGGACEDYVYDRRLRHPDALRWTDKEVDDVVRCEGAK